MLLHQWGLVDALRRAGVRVVETAGWQQRSHGELTSNPAVVWHHDASPQGDSPGALGWMINNYGTASAQIWINRQGVVHLVGTGTAYHAGAVLNGMPGNKNSIGIETDHTTNEDWPTALIDALRLTTVIILGLSRRSPNDALHFHKTICSPPGRKSDPAGLDLGPERARVSAMIAARGVKNLTPADSVTSASATATAVSASPRSGTATATAAPIPVATTALPTRDGLDMAEVSDVKKALVEALREQVFDRGPWNGLARQDVDSAVYSLLVELAKARPVGIFQHPSGGAGEVDILDRTWVGFANPEQYQQRINDLKTAGLAILDFGKTDPAMHGWTQVAA